MTEAIEETRSHPAEPDLAAADGSPGSKRGPNSLRVRELHRDLHTLSVVIRRVLERQPLEALPDASVTVDQMRVLRFVALKPGLRVGQVAEGLGVKPSSASLALDRLEARRLVARQGETSDRRTICVRVTPEGQALVDRVEQCIEGKLETAMARLEARDAEQLPELIRKLVGALFEKQAYIRELCLHCGPGYATTCVGHSLFANCPYS
jgi:DNA-binding MarR family transcriptional regulator